MRISSVIFFLVSVVGLLYPEMLLTHPKPYSRIIFIIILCLVIFDEWRFRRYKRKQRKENKNK